MAPDPKQQTWIIKWTIPGSTKITAASAEDAALKFQRITQGDLAENDGEGVEADEPKLMAEDER